MMLGLGLALPLIPIQGGTVGLSPGGDLFPDAYFAADFVGTNIVRLNGANTSLANTPGISITRATSAYYTDAQGNLSLFPSGAARIGNRGLLVEGAATNLLLRSAEFDNAYWTAARTAVSQDAATAPDGTLTAETITEDATAGNTHAVQRSGVTVTAAAHTLSVYAKNVTRRYLSLRINDNASNANAGAAVFDLQSGVISTAAAAYGTFSAASATITPLANGWYRLTLTVTISVTSVSVKFELNNGSALTADGQSSYTGDGVSGLYLWGAQLEATAYATSYIPTTSGSATRNADVISIGSVTGLAYPVTLFAEFERASDTGGGETLFEVGAAGSIANRIALAVNSADLAQAFVASSNVTQANITVAGAVALGSITRLAARCASNSVQAAKGGVLASEDTTVTVPNASSAVHIGANGAGALFAYSYLRRLAIFPTAYTDAQLQTLTA